MISRLVPLKVGTSSALLVKRPQPFRLRALSSVLTLAAQSLAAPHVDVLFATAGDGTIEVSVNGVPTNFGFAGSDPGGGVVWVDTTGLTTIGEYSVKFAETLNATTGFAGANPGGPTTRVSTDDEGSDVSMVVTQVGGGTLLVSVGPPSTGTDPGAFLPVLSFQFGGVGYMVKVFPETITNAAGGVYEFYFAVGVVPTVAVSPSSARTLVTIRLPEEIGLIDAVQVTLTPETNATVTIGDSFASVEEIMFDPETDFAEWVEDDE